MIQVMSITLLLVTPLLAAPQFDDDQKHISDEVEGAEGPVAWSEEEATTKHLDLEDLTSWSASTEVLDENHAWYRKRRSADVSGVSGDMDQAEHDLAAAESVVFMPAHLRTRRRLAHEECTKRHRDFTVQRLQTDYHGPTRHECNSYCCYPVHG